MGFDGHQDPAAAPRGRDSAAARKPFELRDEGTDGLRGVRIPARSRALIDALESAAAAARLLERSPHAIEAFDAGQQRRLRDALAGLRDSCHALLERIGRIDRI